jgi:HK97 family phage prohead protease
MSESSRMDEYWRILRGTYSREGLPEWIVEHDRLKASRALVKRLRASAAACNRVPASGRPAVRQRPQPVTVRQGSPRQPAAPVRRFSAPSAAARVAVHDIEHRASGGSPGSLSGYAALYGRPSVNLGGFVETLAPGAFRSTVKRINEGSHDLFLLTEHTQQNILARVSAGNLRVEEDSVGLRFTVELPDTQLGRDVRELVARKVLRGMSFSFAPVRDTWPERGKRIVHDLTAYEISIVSTPAYPQTSVLVSRSVPDSVTWSAAHMQALSARARVGRITSKTPRSVAGVAGIEWR